MRGYAARDEFFQPVEPFLLRRSRRRRFQPFALARGEAYLIYLGFFAHVLGKHAFYIDDELLEVHVRIVARVQPLHFAERFFKRAVVRSIVDTVAVKRLVVEHRGFQLHFAVLGIYRLKARYQEEQPTALHALHDVALVILRTGEDIARSDPAPQAALFEPRAYGVRYVLIGRGGPVTDKHVAFRGARIFEFLYVKSDVALYRRVVHHMVLRIRALDKSLDVVEVFWLDCRDERIDHVLALRLGNAAKVCSREKIGERGIVVVVVAFGERDVILSAEIVGKHRQYFLSKKLDAAVVARLAAFRLEFKLLGEILAPGAHVLRVVERHLGERRRFGNVKYAAACFAGAVLARAVGYYGGGTAICASYLFHNIQLYYTTVRISKQYDNH